MTLIWDDYECWWIWVDSKDHNIQLSPAFDEEIHALEWQKTIKKILTGK